MTKWILIYTCIGTALFYVIVKYLESTSVYFPSKEVGADPGTINLAFDDITITTEDAINLKGWYIPSKGAKLTALFLHGNAGNISGRLEKIALLGRLHYNILIIDYRGYGESAGRPTEKGLYRDAYAAYLYLTGSRGVPAPSLVLYGESLGTAVAVHLASLYPVGGIILEGAFSSGRDMAREMYPCLPQAVFSNLFDSYVRITSVKGRKLFLHSRDDGVVPIRLARKLYDAASSPKTFTEMSGSHNNAFLDSQEAYISAIEEFNSMLLSEERK